MSAEEHDASESEDLQSETAFQRLLQDAMAEEPKPRLDLLRGVQHRIRERSRGRFYADRWSLKRVSPVLTYLVTALLMLAILGISYFLLRPMLEAQGKHTASPIGSSAPTHK